MDFLLKILHLARHEFNETLTNPVNWCIHFCKKYLIIFVN